MLTNRAAARHCRFIANALPRFHARRQAQQSPELMKSCGIRERLVAAEYTPQGWLIDI
jgi:hypothetical protein